MKLLKYFNGNYLIVSDDYSQRNINMNSNSLNKTVYMYKTYGLIKKKDLKNKLSNRFKAGLIKEVTPFSSIEELYYLIPEEFV